MNSLQQLAIIGATASGKSALSLAVAQKHNGIILSLDSLSIYKEIDIASAKPTKEERGNIVHFGIDAIYPNEPFDVVLFTDIYKNAKEYALTNNKPLIIVGGSSFYLKTLLEGLSPLPHISPIASQKTKELLATLPMAYEFLTQIDLLYSLKIKPNDRYRVEKALNIYFETSLPPTEYFKASPPQPIIKENLPIFAIDIEREYLRERIGKRTEKMVNDGLIEEVLYLEQKYTREPNPLKAIGIKECFDFIDGKITKQELIELITIHTAQLAKRQTTFNRTQFKEKIVIQNDELEIFTRYLQ